MRRHQHVLRGLIEDYQKLFMWSLYIFFETLRRANTKKNSGEEKRDAYKSNRFTIKKTKGHSVFPHHFP